MRLTIIMIVLLALGVGGCQKVVEHVCKCRNLDGQIVATDTHLGNEDNARDLCAQKQEELNQDNLGASDVFTCELD